jgi:hypothetical protein
LTLKFDELNVEWTEMAELAEMLSRETEVQAAQTNKSNKIGLFERSLDMTPFLKPTDVSIPELNVLSHPTLFSFRHSIF